MGDYKRSIIVQKLLQVLEEDTVCGLPLHVSANRVPADNRSGGSWGREFVIARKLLAANHSVVLEARAKLVVIAQRSGNNLLGNVTAHAHTHYWLFGGRGSTKSSFISLAIVLVIIANPEADAVTMSSSPTRFATRCSSR